MDVSKGDISEMTYAQVPGGIVMTVRRKGDGDAVRFKGFRGSDLAGLKELCKANFGVSLEKREMQINGRNWGEVDLDQTGALHFSVDGKTSFEVATRDIAACNLASKHEVMMEFHLDDTVAQASKDALVEMSFYVPPTSGNWGVDPDEDDPDDTGAKRLQEAILEVADTEHATGEAIAEFESVSLVAPRGKVTIELHGSFLKLSGAAVDFKIQYGSIQRLFLLPKPNNVQVYAVMHLDPPIRKGQTFYNHIVATFNANEELEVEPNLETPELKTKFANLEDSYDGPSSEVFVRLLKAVAGCKLTRQGTFKSQDGGHAVKASHKAEVGHLFPLEKSFFYLPKPSLLLPYTEVDAIEFERHSGAYTGATQRTFDIVVLMKSDASHTFHGIPKAEFQNLVNFLNAKQLNISNVDANARADQIIDEDEEEDHHAARLKARAAAEAEDFGGGSDSEEDEDFDAGSDDSDGGEPSDESESESEDEEEDSRPKKKSKSGAKKGKSPAKKKKAKKDPNAPKRPLSSYMLFAGDNRSKVLEENPGLSLGEVGKELGKRWKELPDGEKAAYEERAKEAKAAYDEAMREYKKSKVVDDDEDSD